jgi:CRP-like cAMP-binding protein
MQPGLKTLKKGELLFHEGDSSKAMYLIRSGVLRIFKKKGEQSIEIDTVRSGQILGELAFLDGKPRSASAEALSDCTLVEISTEIFAQAVIKMPEWLKILLKTVVGRLRTATTRIKNLESSSTTFQYGEMGTERVFVYISPQDLMRFLAALLLSETQEHGISISTFERHANQVFQLPGAKTTSLLDLFTELSWLTETEGNLKITDSETLRSFLSFLEEQSLVEPSKRIDLSPRLTEILGWIAEDPNLLAQKQKSSYRLNLGPIRKSPAGLEKFRIDEVEGLVSVFYLSPLNLQSPEEQWTEVNPKLILQHSQFHKTLGKIAELNAQKKSTKARSAS